MYILVRNIGKAIKLISLAWIVEEFILIRLLIESYKNYNSIPMKVIQKIYDILNLK